MSASQCSKLKDALLRHYRIEEFPSLHAQCARWEISRPLQGVRVLAATPVFRNTMCQYWSLSSAGADVCAGFGGGIPFDPEIVRALPDFGIRTVENNTAMEQHFDLVLDCGGVNAKRDADFFVELTRSGAHHYQSIRRPAIVADDSRIKTIETALGTGDGFHRAMRQLGLGDFARRNFTLFGCGKVGFGIARAILGNQGFLTIVDRAGSVAQQRAKQLGAAFVSLASTQNVGEAVKQAWCVISATGLKNAVGDSCSPDDLAAATGYFVNMGVEDEFGSGVPVERVLNHKEPLNFLLEEPTQLKYIDPTLALHNLAGCELILHPGNFQPGINPVRPEWEENICADAEKNGQIGEELRDVWKGLFA